MKPRKSRTAAKVFLAITALFLFFALVAWLLWIVSQKIALPFVMRFDYVMAVVGFAAILLVVTLWLFALSRTRKGKEKVAESADVELTEEVLVACAAEPYTPRQRAVLNALAVRRKQARAREAKRKNAAKLLVPLVGGFALGVAVSAWLKKRK